MKRGIWLLPFLLIGCSKSASQQVCEMEAELWCSFLFDCCNAPERARLLDLDDLRADFDDPDEIGQLLALGVSDDIDKGACVDTLSKVCRLNSEELSIAEDEGRLVVSTDSAERCFQPLRQAVDNCDPKVQT